MSNIYISERSDVGAPAAYSVAAPLWLRSWRLFLRIACDLTTSPSLAAIPPCQYLILRQQIKYGLTLALEGMSGYHYELCFTDLNRVQTLPPRHSRRPSLRWPRRLRRHRRSLRLCSKGVGVRRHYGLFILASHMFYALLSCSWSWAGGIGQRWSIQLSVEAL